MPEFNTPRLIAAYVEGLNKDAVDLKAPWTYQFGNADNPQNGCVYDSGGKLIHLSAMVTVGDAARLRLIAAAPETAAQRDRLLAVNAELLAALRAIVFQALQGKVLERDSCVSQGQAALAKATGQEEG